MSKRSGYWITPINKDIQTLLLDLHEEGWRILDPPKYYKALCPCGLHKTTIHLTPSSRYYLNNKRQDLRNKTCFKNQRRR